MDGQITVTLTKDDEGIILANSVAQANYNVDTINERVIFPFNLFTPEAWAIGVDMIPISGGVKLLPSRAVIKECDAAEWTALTTAANSLTLVEGWYKDELELLVGVGNVTIL